MTKTDLRAWLLNIEVNTIMAYEGKPKTIPSKHSKIAGWGM